MFTCRKLYFHYNINFVLLGRIFQIYVCGCVQQKKCDINIGACGV